MSTSPTFGSEDPPRLERYSPGTELDAGTVGRLRRFMRRTKSRPGRKARRSAFAWLLLGLLFGCVPLSAATAQSDVWTNEAARRLFDEGVRLASEGRWPDALDRFRESQQLVPRASTSYNIANALYRLDRPAQAIEELEKSAGIVDPADRALRERREALQALAEARVAEVRVQLTPPTATLSVDGVIVPGFGSPRLLRLDPGPRALRLAEDGYAPYEATLLLAPGARASQSLILEPIHHVEPNFPAAPTQLSTQEQAPLPQEPSEERRFVRSPGFWALIGVLAAAGVGAGVAAVVLRSGDPPQCGTTGACATVPTRAALSF